MKKSMIAVLGLLLVGSVLLASAKSQGGDEVNKEELPKVAPEVILEVEWGSGPGQLGYKMGPPLGGSGSDIVIGPNCVALDSEGRMYILDMVNGRVNVYERTKGFIRAIPLELPGDVIIDKYAFQDMQVDNEDHIYVGYTINLLSVFVFNREGVLLRRYLSESNLRRRINGKVKFKKKLNDEMGEDLLDEGSKKARTKALGKIDDSIRRAEKYSRDSSVMVVDRLKGCMTITSNRNGDVVVGRQGCAGMLENRILDSKTGMFLSMAERYEEAIREMEAEPYSFPNGKKKKLMRSLDDEYVDENGFIYKLVWSVNQGYPSKLKVLRWGDK